MQALASGARASVGTSTEVSISGLPNSDESINNIETLPQLGTGFVAVLMPFQIRGRQTRLFSGQLKRSTLKARFYVYNLGWWRSKNSESLIFFSLINPLMSYTLENLSDHRVSYTIFFLYKNVFYKNIQAESCEILRIF